MQAVPKPAAAAPAGADWLQLPAGLPTTGWGDKPEPRYAKNRVLVTFKQTPTAAGVAAAQARSPLPGVRLARLVGKHHKLRVPRAGAAAGASAATLSSVPADATMLMEITGVLHACAVELLCSGAARAAPRSPPGRARQLSARRPCAACPASLLPQMESL